MKRVVEILILLPLAIILIVLAIANRTPVSLSIDPFDPTAPDFLVTVPLFWVIFASLAIGIVLGGLAVWMQQARYRRAARVYRKEAERLRTETERPRTPVPPQPIGPALPPPTAQPSRPQITARA